MNKIRKHHDGILNDHICSFRSEGALQQAMDQIIAVCLGLFGVDFV